MYADENLTTALDRYGRRVHDTIRAALDAHTVPADFYGMVRYHLGFADAQLRPIAAPRGKGLRAALLLLLAESCGGITETALPLAAAIELLHNFSLVHDDIEDGSTTRRHRRTAWTIWGIPLTLNMGDGLYALAHLMLFESPLRSTAPERFIAILQAFEQAALRLCEGQHLDMTFEGMDEVTLEDYLRMIRGKTAALMALSAWIGAYAAGADDERAGQAARFGEMLGLAFQMQDDILGIWGDEDATGKSSASDIVSRKKTLPVLLALVHASPDDATRLRALYARPHAGQGDTGEIVSILHRAGARALSEDYVRRYRNEAMDAITRLGLDTPAQDRLVAFARLFVERVS